MMYNGGKRRFAGKGMFLFAGVFLLMTITYTYSVSQNAQIQNSVFSSSGGKVRKLHASLQHTVGQPTPIGISQNNGFNLYAGFQATTLREFSPPTYYGGDVDGDGDVTVLDVLAVVNDILHLIPLNGEALLAADCNGDGAVNVLDVIGIINVILGISSCVN